MGCSVSIVIATKGRLDGLARLFASLKNIPHWREIRPQVIIGNNADEPGLAPASHACGGALEDSVSHRPR